MPFQSRLICLATLIGPALFLPGCQCASSETWVGMSAQITGASMAPNMPGEHIRLHCPECRNEYSIDATHLPPDRRIICGRCGLIEELSLSHKVEPGQVAVVDRTGLDSLNRWDPVALRHPVDRDTFAVKRLIGLPGEQVEIAEGEIWIDGEIVRKSLAEQISTRIEVYHLPADTRQTFDRWQPSGSWQRLFGKFVCGDEDRVPAEDSWLTYRNKYYVRTRILDPTRQRPVLGAINDNYTYNQYVARNLHSCTDLMIELGGSLAGNPRWTVEIHDGRAWTTVDFAVADSVLAVSRSDRELVRVPVVVNPDQSEFRLLVSTFDRQITVGWDDREVARIPLSDPEAEPAFHSEPIRIRAASASVRLNRLMIYRDVYYLPATDTTFLKSQFVVPRGHVFLLGDNVPVSRDSRHWGENGVPEELILGRVHDLDTTTGSGP